MAEMKIGGRFALLLAWVSVVFFLPSYKPLYQVLDWAGRFCRTKALRLLISKCIHYDGGR
jgi:hypothetical protein